MIARLGRDRGRPRRPASRRGLSVLEVVVAVAVLTLSTGMVTAAIGTLGASRARADHRLAAAEAAHRVILQFNDDPTTVTTGDSPVEVDGYVFDFVVRQSILQIAVDGFQSAARVEPAPVSFDEAKRDIAFLLTNRLWRVEVDVIARERGHGFNPGDTVATLSRVYDVLGEDDPEKLIELITRLLADELDAQ